MKPKSKKSKEIKAIEPEVSEPFVDDGEDEESMGSVGMPLVLSEELEKGIAEKIERGELLQFSIKKGRGYQLITFDPKNEGIRPAWRMFVDEYFKNGFNGTRAYHFVFPDVKESTAATEACLMLKNPKVVDLIRRKLEAEEVDDEWVIANLKEKASFNDSFRINAAVAAVATLAKVRGMLVDTKKIVFDQNNPAVFNAPYTAEEKAQFDLQSQKGGRITE